MRHDPDRHHRRSLRLSSHDYSGTGTYFVTLVAQDRACLFGEVAGGQVHLNAAGLSIESACAPLPEHYTQVDLGIFVVMPNHFHAILNLVPTAFENAADRLVGGCGWAVQINNDEAVYRCREVCGVAAISRAFMAA